MGCSNTKDPTSKLIDASISKDKKNFNREMKILLLGGGESGKSTIAKQMRIIHEDRWDTDERIGFQTIIHNNVHICTTTILNAMEDPLAIALDANVKEAAEAVMEDWEGVLTPELADHIDALWNSKSFKEAYDLRAEYQLSDSADYYLSDVKRLAESDYVPTDQDILRSRVKTTGILETHFEIGGTKFTMVDVGGQRSERKKWIHCFQDVTAILFCCALSGFNLTCYEDNETNRMEESITLFKEITGSKWFIETSVLLFLNKSDLFAEKLEAGVPLTIAFKDYEGDNSFEDACEFIEDKFVEINPDKDIYPHVTCATDTGNVKVVWEAVQDIILRQALARSGLTI
eukprot:TRINITY_DN9896_c0_g1_i1.p1 TRINITY_DN9896_c0_g1~~TRINITY_DN9896_c0_g1_i1.p1  ORF type:complete len:345 (-),score=102.18 TRINITY_DN9896_c0_g1_i1:54-1088(-)